MIDVEVREIEERQPVAIGEAARLRDLGGALGGRLLLGAGIGVELGVLGGGVMDRSRP